ncbi:MAG TPA: CorA family divalent cation transporter [Pseudomonadales bacterium]|nr:CorA family divalent cation transporter [Pseudomonadales bacterium]
MINAFELERGRLRQVQVESIDELRHCQPVWIDFVDASDQERDWASTLYGIDLPEAHEIGDIEARARFFEEKTDNGDELHIRSDFFHEDDDGSQSIRVAFVLKNSMLFSVHPEDLPQFRLVRMRARSQPGYVGKPLIREEIFSIVPCRFQSRKGRPPFSFAACVFHGKGFFCAPFFR